jgi:hypothetical protein
LKFRLGLNPNDPLACGEYKEFFVAKLKRIIYYWFIEGCPLFVLSLTAVVAVVQDYLSEI